MLHRRLLSCILWYGTHSPTSTPPPLLETVQQQHHPGFWVGVWLSLKQILWNSPQVWNSKFGHLHFQVLSFWKNYCYGFPAAKDGIHIYGLFCLCLSSSRFCCTNQLKCTGSNHSVICRRSFSVCWVLSALRLGCVVIFVVRWVSYLHLFVCMTPFIYRLLPLLVSAYKYITHKLSLSVCHTNMAPKTLALPVVGQVNNPSCLTRYVFVSLLHFTSIKWCK